MDGSNFEVADEKKNVAAFGSGRARRHRQIAEISRAARASLE